jgi:hypothetical protein
MMYLQLEFVYKRHRRQEDWPRHPSNDGLGCGQIAHDQITCGLAARKAPIIADRGDTTEKKPAYPRTLQGSIFSMLFISMNRLYFIRCSLPPNLLACVYATCVSIPLQEIRNSKPSPKTSSRRPQPLTSRRYHPHEAAVFVSPRRRVSCGDLFRRVKESSFSLIFVQIFSQLVCFTWED